MAVALLQREILMLAAIEDEMPRRDLRRQRIIRDREHPFELDEYRFKRLFRLRKETVFILCDRLEERLSGQNALGIPPNIKILVALRFFAVGCYQLAIGQHLCLAVSQPSVSRCVRRVCDAIIEILMPEHIKFPTTDEEQMANKIGFSKIANFPGIIGAIDGTHIAIIAPSEDEEYFREYLYVNRKGFHSLNVQIVCDHKLRITNVNAKFPGSSHDSHVFRMSQVSTYLEQSYTNGTRSSWLIGDSGYPLKPWLMTPITHTVANSAEERFDNSLTKTRQVVERTIGVLKQVFRCLLLHRTLHYHPTAAARTVYACATLHNLRRDRAHQDEDDDFSETESSSDSDFDNEEGERLLRRRVQARQRRRRLRQERRALVIDVPQYEHQANESWLLAGQGVRQHLIQRFH